jgi:hypothetical protein
MSSSPTIHVSPQIVQRLKAIKETHGLSNNTDVVEHILRVYDESLARENVVAPQPAVPRKKKKKKGRKQLLKWDDVKDHDEVLTYVTGLSKGTREWLLSKLEKKANIFFLFCSFVLYGRLVVFLVFFRLTSL